MSRSFYEFPRPIKIIYTVSVRPDDPNTCECAVADCKTHQDEAEYDTPDIDVWQCDCCGQWFCIEHISQKSDLCDACEALPPGIRTMIEAFREELNR